MSFDRDDMLDTYLLETGQILEELQELVLRYRDKESFSDDAVAEIFRYMHTMKGSAGFMMFEQVNKLTHKAEDVFYYIREDKPRDVPQAELIELVLGVCDFIQGDLDRLSEGEMADADATELIAKLDVFLEDIRSRNNGGEALKKSRKSEEATQIYIAPADTKASHYFQIYIIYARDTKLANVHAYKIVHALKPIADDIRYTPSTILTDEKSADEILEQGFKILLKTNSPKRKIEQIVSEGYETESIEIGEIDAARYDAGFRFFGVDATVAAKHVDTGDDYVPGDFVVHGDTPGGGKILAKDTAAVKNRNSHVNVDTADMDRLADLVMKLIKTEDKLFNDEEIRGAGLKLEGFDRNADKLRVITGTLNDIVTNMRMVPLTNIFLRMNRIIFEASRKLNKDIDCLLVGEEIRADRGIVEHIADPLMHMVRNSADHGIEEAAERIAKGKPVKGRITLKAEVSDGELRISVSDDGAGLDRDAILKKAHERGLTDRDRSDAEYTDEEVWRFITLPGFSTNTDITEFSGRGVGMDVVVSAIEQIGGRLDIESVSGQGSTMTISFPV